jgi:hypothetical protein
MTPLDSLWYYKSFRSQLASLLALSPETLDSLASATSEEFHIEPEAAPPEARAGLPTHLRVVEAAYFAWRESGEDDAKIADAVQQLVDSDPEVSGLDLDSRRDAITLLFGERKQYEHHQARSEIESAYVPTLVHASFGADLRVRDQDGDVSLIPIALARFVVDDGTPEVTSVSFQFGMEALADLRSKLDSLSDTLDLVEQQVERVDSSGPLP